jgi:hypothetical protein
MYMAEEEVKTVCSGDRASWPGWKGGFTQGQRFRTTPVLCDSWLELLCSPF